MANAKIENPFIVGKYVSDKYFCDREKESEFILKQIINGRNVALISDRRMGKSGLIQHVFAQKSVTNNFNTIYIDIYATSCLSEFVYLFGKAVFDLLKPHRTKRMEKFFSIVSSLQVGIKWDPINGEPGLDIGIGDIKQPDTTLDEIFRYLESSEKRCLVAIDEFQQVGEYGEKNIEALLRTKIQQCTNVQFIFSGSKKHVMSNMFHSPAKPFYQSAIIMGLEAIPIDKYIPFVQKLFVEGKKTIASNVISTVYNDYDGTTWFIQMMMNELYSLTAENGDCTCEMIDIARKNIIQVQEYGYKEILSNLSIRQRQLLQAIARDRKVSGITSADFVSKNSLGSASSVQAALNPLLDKSLVAKTDDSYRIYDYFLSEWIRTNY
jgi:hypothetical protein